MSSIQDAAALVADPDGSTEADGAIRGRLSSSLGALRVLLLATHRPEYRHGWSGKSYFSQLRLLPLASAAAERQVDGVATSKCSIGTLISFAGRPR